MPNRNLAFIDWSDPARQGAHTAVYVDGEVQDYLVAVISPWRTYRPFVEPDAGGTGLRALQVYGAQTSENSIAAFHSKNPLPPNFFVESLIYPPIVGTNRIPHLQTFDDDLEGPYYSMWWSDASGAVLFMWHPNNTNYNFKVRNIIGVSTEVIAAPLPTTPSQWLWTSVIKRPSGLTNFVHHKAGQFYRVAHRAAAGIKDFDKIQRFAPLQGMGGSLNYGWVQKLAISEYDDFNLMLEAGVAVTAGGSITVENAPDAKTALTDGTESGRIVTNNTGWIEIDLTGAANDVPILEVQVVANSTDANPLSIKFQTQDMVGGALWSSSVSLGDTQSDRASGEKIDPSWTNSMRHVFFHELRFLLGIADTDSPGCRKIRIENNTGAQIIVNEVQVIQGVQDISFENNDGPNLMEFDYKIPSSDVPIGSTGTIQTINVTNTTQHSTASADVLMIDDGFTAGTPILEYAAAPGGPWYDKVSAPPGPDGISLTPGAVMPFYVRSIIPSSGEVLQRFRASFQVKLVNA